MLFTSALLDPPGQFHRIPVRNIGHSRQEDNACSSATVECASTVKHCLLTPSSCFRLASKHLTTTAVACLSRCHILVAAARPTVYKCRTLTLGAASDFVANFPGASRLCQIHSLMFESSLMSTEHWPLNVKLPNVQSYKECETIRTASIQRDKKF